MTDIKNRSEVPLEYTWKLSDIFESDDKWTQELEALKAYPEIIAGYKGTLTSSAENLYNYSLLEDELSVRLSKLLGYASCKSDEDISNGFYQDMRGKALSVYVMITEAASFAAPEMLSAGKEKLNLYLASTPRLLPYKRSIDSILRKEPHTLSAECESLLAAAEEMAQSPDTIGGVFRNADMKFDSVTDSCGQSHQLTSGSFVPLLESSDRLLRERVFKSYYASFNSYKNTAAAIIDAQFKQLNYFASARKFGSTLEASLFATEVPVSVYTSLIDAVHANLSKMYRYVALRKKMLGVDTLHMYDVYTPLVSDEGRSYSFEYSKKTVLDALGVLGTDYTDVLKEAFNNRWIDVYENSGKRSGAYSTDVSVPHPYVLLNHKDNLDSMFTLAHEMGHALHSYNSTKHQPTATGNYVIFVAEVASTCNEVLLMRFLLANTQDKQQKMYLINHFLDQFKGTVYRQTMFAEFEMLIGKMSEQGITLTADELCNKYYELNKLYFGPDMESDDEIKLEWARIPHFFYNYYVFQYATGFAAAVAIADRILKEGKPAVDDYKRFLSSGSSKDPISLLKIAGVNMSTNEPVNKALELFGSLLDELEQLC